MNVHLIEFVALVIALILAAMSAAAETALTAISPSVLHTLAQQSRAGRIIAYLKRDPSRFLSTILIVNSTSLIVASSMATLITRDLPGPWGEIVATIGLSIVVLIFVELTPKNLAVRQPQRVATFLAPPVRIFSIVLNPLIVVVSAIVSILMRSMGQPGGSHPVPTISEDEFRATVNLAEQSEGGLTEEEAERIEGVLDLEDVSAGEVMKPRVDIVAVPVSTPLMDVLDVILLEGHSRIPVYDESIDNVVGILYDKDLLKYLRENELEVSLSDIARPAIFVPESKRASDLLREFQFKKVHMAIVSDEYGGTAGLVTIEDLLEEIVGEIQDEYDKEDPLWERVNEYEYVFDAMMRIEDVNDEMDVDLPADNGVETLGGFVFERVGEIPEVGNRVTVDRVTLEVTEIEGRRIKKIRLIRSADTASAADDDNLQE